MIIKMSNIKESKEIKAVCKEDDKADIFTKMYSEHSFVKEKEYAVIKEVLGDSTTMYRVVNESGIEHHISEMKFKKHFKVV